MGPRLFGGRGAGVVGGIVGDGSAMGVVSILWLWRWTLGSGKVVSGRTGHGRSIASVSF